MATARQVTTYAKTHGITRAEAREHFASQVQKRPTPFFVDTKVFADGLPVIDKSKLDDLQIEFVEGCEKSFVEMKKEHPDTDYNYSMVMYINKDDFLGTMMEAKDPDFAEIDNRKIWNKSQRQTIMSGYHQVGQIWTLDMIEEKGGQMAGFACKHLAEDGQWAWPNAKATFTKKGDDLLVTSVFN